MNKLTKKDVEHIAKLSNLNLTPNETETFTKQLSSVIGHFSELANLETKGVEPTSQTTRLVNITRPDKIDTTRILNQKLATSESENIHNNYFVVDQVIDKSNE